MDAATGYAHIVIDEQGVPLIAGTTLKVVELVLEAQAYRWGPDALQAAHPTLALGQIHSALAYYYDHQAELDADIERRWQEVGQLRQAAPPSPFVARMRREGRL